MSQEVTQLRTCRRRARRRQGCLRALTDLQKAAKERRRVRRSRRKAGLPTSERCWPRISTHSLGYGRIRLQRPIPDGLTVIFYAPYRGQSYVRYDPRTEVRS